MSLGSIAHLQYYFARTGMLDGKGGQLARERKKGGSEFRVSIANYSDGSEMAGGEPAQASIEEEDEFQDWEEEPMMLPPTVSTYSHKTQYLPPPPDAETLRHELRCSLFHVTTALSEVRSSQDGPNRRQDQSRLPSLSETLEVREDGYPSQPSPNRGWHEIQGMHMLDVVTLAIRAAKIYYTTHEHPQRFSKVKTERQIREDLLGVLDVLKRMATRNFAGGMKEEEIGTMEGWVRGVEDLLTKEKVIEEQENKDRESWAWLEGAWADGDRMREWQFMSTFLKDVVDGLPEWQAPSEAAELPTPFLASLANGLHLVQLHNRVLKKSRRQFGEIKSFHTDTLKPYRAAENLRFWIKEAEIRWETKLQVDVMAIVYRRGDRTWLDFDAAILRWCRAVREEITKEWKKGAVQVSSPIAATFVTE
jgi:hypothetical protein